MNGRELALKALIGFENKGKTVKDFSGNAKEGKYRLACLSLDLTLQRNCSEQR